MRESSYQKTEFSSIFNFQRVILLTNELGGFRGFKMAKIQKSIKSLEQNEELSKLFFELASESRLGILQKLEDRGLRMQEVARVLGLGDTETSRQLQRLSEAMLIQKQPDGVYSITQNGKLLLEFSHSFEFVVKFKKCLVSRDLWRLPYQFINRLGELSEAYLITDVSEMMNSFENIILGAEKFLFCIGRKPIRSLSVKAGKPVEKGVPLKLLFDEENQDYYRNYVQNKYFEMRVIPAAPAIMVVSEKCATINLLSLDNRQDVRMFYGQDPKILKWATDLFQYYWDQGKHFE